MENKVDSIVPNVDDLATPCPPTWCPGCGNFAVLGAFKKAAIQEGWNSTNTSLVAGIGCHGHILNSIKITALEGLHGRAIPVASGLKFANHGLNVFVFTGDGDCLGEGGNHFVHACRRNHNITVILHNNNLYGLTTGQTSPTSPKSFKTKSTPYGNPDNPIRPLTLALASGATFLARASATDIPSLAELIIKANEHQGVSIIEVIQACVSFNKEFGHDFFRENTYFLGKSYDPTNKEAAFLKTMEWGSKQIPLGIFYQVVEPTAESQFPQLDSTVLIEKPVEKRDVTELFKRQS